MASASVRIALCLWQPFACLFSGLLHNRARGDDVVVSLQDEDEAMQAAVASGTSFATPVRSWWLVQQQTAAALHLQTGTPPKHTIGDLVAILHVLHKQQEVTVVFQVDQCCLFHKGHSVFRRRWRWTRASTRGGRAGRQAATRPTNSGEYRRLDLRWSGIER